MGPGKGLNLEHIEPGGGGGYRTMCAHQHNIFFNGCPSYDTPIVTRTELKLTPYSLVLEAADVSIPADDTACNPYVKISLIPAIENRSIEHRTKVVIDNKDPAFRETFLV